MILNELFNSKPELKVTADSDYRFAAEVDLAGKKITIEADDGNHDNRWDVAFGEELADGHSSIGMTGTGQEFAVMAAVKLFMEKFVKERNPQRIQFDTFKRDKGRVKVYTSMLKKFCPPNYEFTIENLGSGVFFFMTKRS